jgi:hypothetical protein
MCNPDDYAERDRFTWGDAFWAVVDWLRGKR